jgi:hypothetical protein
MWRSLASGLAGGGIANDASPISRFIEHKLLVVYGSAHLHTVLFHLANLMYSLGGAK